MPTTAAAPQDTATSPDTASDQTQVNQPHEPAPGAPESQQTDVSAAPAAEAATSSGAEETGAKPALTLQDVIKTAIDEQRAAATPAAADAKKTEADQAASDAAKEPEGDKAAADKEELPPFHKHPRWKEVVGERDTLKTKLAEVEPDAQQYRKITGFMQEHELTPAEVAEGFQIMALMRKDPAAALKALSTHVQQLQLYTGERLPDDLDRKVQDGQVDRETAQELSRTRIAASQAQAGLQQTVRQTAEQQESGRRQAIGSAVSQWETQIRSQDPDYSRKEQLVMDRVRVKLAEKQPADANEALQIAAAAYKEISDLLRPIARPATTSVRPVSSSLSSTQARPAPKTMLDAVNAALGR